MKEKINIAKILKDKPQGTKLYSLTYGDCSYQEYTGDFGIECQSQNGVQFSLDEYGRYCIEGECILFPSKEMQDWENFAWKRGDVLAGAFGVLCIFEKWANADYTKFDSKFVTQKNRGTTFEIKDWYKVTNKAVIKQYISDIEEDNGGKLNLESLEIEKTQPELKDGDIVFMKGIKGGYYANCIFILRSEYKDGDERAFYYAFYNTDDKFTEAEYGNTKVHYSLRSATDSEKQQLFDALAKKGKTWDAEKKAIVDLPKKCEFKAMDWCLMRDKKETWKLCQFSFFDDGDYEAPYNAVGGNWFDECIPYNEETKHLLGTTDEWEGGEG
jgi:hypothetical protein